MKVSLEEEAGVYPRVLVLLRRRLEERGFEVQGVVKPGGRWRGMRPIYSALREMERVGTRLASGRGGEEMMELNVASMNQKRPMRLRLWNLELGQTQVISLTDTGVGAGEYLGERINIQEQGWWRWRRETVGQVESEHFGNAGEAIEWLVEKIAPCVIAAGGLALRKPQ